MNVPGGQDGHVAQVHQADNQVPVHDEYDIDRPETQCMYDGTGTALAQIGSLLRALSGSGAKLDPLQEKAIEFTTARARNPVPKTGARIATLV